MKLTRFLCAAALAAGIAGSIGMGSASAAATGPVSAESTATCATPRPGDTEWSNPATHCPPIL